MNKEETISNLKAYLNGDTAIGNIIPLRSVLESALEYLEPSLPSNLDEAASVYANQDAVVYATRKKSFKAGAEWMAGQGVTSEGEILDVSGRPLADRVIRTVSIKDMEQCLKDFNKGDKVIIQIRKK